MTPLRQKMVDAMALRGFSPRTHQSYLFAVQDLARHYHQSPEQLTLDQLQSYFLYLVKERHLSAASARLYLNGIRFLYVQVLQWPELELQLNVPKKPQKIPELLTSKEVAALIGACEHIKHRQLLSLCYGCGLRVSELVAVKVRHLDGERQLLRVEQGKGNKDRHIPLSPALLQQLRKYWKEARPRHWLFEHGHASKPLSVSSAQKIYQQAKQKAKIEKIGGIHSLRHAYATHQLSQGLPVYQLQNYLGHADIHSTMRYIHWVHHYREVSTDVDLIEQLEFNDE